MKRLIDANALAKFIDYGHLNNPNEKLYSENDIREMIDMMPTVDAIPIEFIKARMEGYYKNSYTELGACLETLIEDWRKENETD